MRSSSERFREAESAYFVQDHENVEELTRLEGQDRMLTNAMGGVLPELADPDHLQRVLDVGCGTGGWLMEVARTYPQITQLVGADISGKMMMYARTQAAHQGLDQRVRFEIMDALRILEFPPASFDLVNQRLGASWIRQWEWRKLLQEYQRVTRPGGVIRLTEAAIVESNSPALTTLCQLVLEASFRSACFFERRPDGIIFYLVHLMALHGIEAIQTRDCALVFQAGTPEHQQFSEDMRSFFRVSLPFLHKWTRVPSNYDAICQQAMNEIQQPDFVATWPFRTVWGTRSRTGQMFFTRGLR